MESDSPPFRDSPSAEDLDQRLASERLCVVAQLDAVDRPVVAPEIDEIS